MKSLVEALEEKYGGNECSTESENSEEEPCVSIFVPRTPARVTVPALLVLNDCDITTAGEQDALTDKCAAVEELDLAKNKLNKWLEICEILHQMPRLKFVNLSFNQLSEPLSEGMSPKCCNLKNLVLNSTLIDWHSVDRILDHAPALEELHLSLNDYKDVNLTCNKRNQSCDPIDNDNANCTCGQLHSPVHKHLGIRKLHFNGNPISCWTEVSKLGYAFPNLEYLVLADCPIETLNRQTDYECNRNAIEDTKAQKSHDSFELLKYLNLNGTQLSTWDEVERLAQYPNLHCLRMQGCPLWDSCEYTEHERRQLLIARLPNVQTLNGGGAIGHDEREDAERAFIRYYMDKPESERPERYFELVHVHGKLDPLVSVDLRPEKRVRVTFTCGSNSEVRSVDVYRTVIDLKAKLEAFAGFSAARMRLFYVDQDSRDISGPEEMKYPHKQLYSYNIRSGDEIIIDCKKKLSEMTHLLPIDVKAAMKDAISFCIPIVKDPLNDITGRLTASICESRFYHRTPIKSVNLVCSPQLEMETNSMDIQYNNLIDTEEGEERKQVHQSNRKRNICECDADNKAKRCRYDQTVQCAGKPSKTRASTGHHRMTEDAVNEMLFQTHGSRIYHWQGHDI